MPLISKAVANYFLETAKADRNQFLSPMKLQKLVYFAQGWHLGLNSNTLIEEQVEAWPWGPVVPCLYHEFKHFGNDPITDLATELDWQKGDPSNFDLELTTPQVPSDDDNGARYTRHFLNKIWETYGHYSATQLSNLTHEPNTPWDRIKKQNGGKIPKGIPIPRELLRDYFQKLAYPIAAAS